MSATNRSDVRRSDDDYSTPSWCTSLILPYLPVVGRILDPCCGSGAILSVVREHIKHNGVSTEIFGLELNQQRAEACQSIGFGNIRCCNALENRSFGILSWSKPELVITNPPYSLAQEFVSKALLECSTQHGTVCMLLRLNWLASKRRAYFHKDHPSDVYVLSKRPSFTADGATDATEYAWFVWGPGRGNRWYILEK